MKVDERFVKADHKGEEGKKIVIKAAEEGEINAYIKHPDTGDAILVPPILIKRMRNGGRVTIDDILSYNR